MAYCLRNSTTFVFQLIAQLWMIFLITQDIGNVGRSCLDSEVGGPTNCLMGKLQGRPRISTHLQGHNSSSILIVNKNNLLVYNKPPNQQGLHDQDML